MLKGTEMRHLVTPNGIRLFESRLHCVGQRKAQGAMMPEDYKIAGTE